MNTKTETKKEKETSRSKGGFARSWPVIQGEEPKGCGKTFY